MELGDHPEEVLVQAEFGADVLEGRREEGGREGGREG